MFKMLSFEGFDEVYLGLHYSLVWKREENHNGQMSKGNFHRFHCYKIVMLSGIAVRSYIV